MGTTYDRFPRSYKDGTLKKVSSGDWTAGFFPGCLWFMYAYTGDTIWQTRARHWTDGAESGATNNSHDVGFVIMCSYGNGLPYQSAAQITRDTAVMMLAARTLYGRYSKTVGATKSWDSFTRDGTQYTFPVIVDNMMNLELLNWATHASSDSSFMDAAITHAQTTMKNHFRADNSSYHVVAYDPDDGAVLKKVTHQGYADESAWARGQSWGLYGYTMMYRMVGDTAFLNQAVRIAEYILSRLGSDEVPYWDYDAPLSPEPPHDASAAAIAASGLLELCTFVEGAARQTYHEKAVAILETLASSAYTAQPSTNGNFILMHSTGNKPKDSEVDVPITYADYYYLEALLRLKKIEEATVMKPARKYSGAANAVPVRKMIQVNKGSMRVLVVVPGVSAAILYDVCGRKIDKKGACRRQVTGGIFLPW